MALAVSAVMGTSACRPGCCSCRRMASVAANPSISGMWQSMRIRSTGVPMAIAIVSWPISARDMRKPSSSSMLRATSRFNGLSSTTRTCPWCMVRASNLTPRAAVTCSVGHHTRRRQSRSWDCRAGLRKHRHSLRVLCRLREHGRDQWPDRACGIVGSRGARRKLQLWSCRPPMSIHGYDASIVLERPPRAVNSPVTRAFTGRAAATISLSMRLTAFS